MSNFDTFTANEAIAMIEDMIASDGEDFQMNSAIVLLGRMEEAEAVTDEDSNHDDTGDVNHFLRKYLLHISIARTVSGMLSIDSWYQETHISSISMPSFDIIRNFLILPNNFYGQTRAWSKTT